MLKDMKIKKSLVMGFGIAIVVAMILVFGTLTMMNRQRAGYQNIINHQIRASELIMECRLNTNIAARNVRDMALRPGDSGNSALEQRARDLMSQVDTYIVELKEVYPLEDVQLLNNYLDTIAEWRAELPTILDSINAGRSAEAVVLLNNKCSPKLNDMVEEAKALTDALTAAENDAIGHQSKSNLMMMIAIVAVGIVATVAVVLLALKLISTIVEPTHQVHEALMGFSEGHFDIDVDYESKNELGEMCQALRTSQQVLRSVVSDECYLLNQMAHGNFAIRSKDTSVYVGGLKPVLESIRVINGKLSDTLSQIAMSAEQVNSGSEQVSTGAQALAQGATEQASAVEELSATVSDISNNAQKNAENSRSAMEFAQNAGDRVNESAQYMEEMVRAMGDISDASQEIGKIISTIENIAFQTNILALNAAVEAARAGSAGKGFAVVADEVRNLATKSDQAAKATKELIDRSIASVQNGSGIVKKVSDSLERTVDAADHTMELIKNIAKAADEEAEAIAQVTEGLDQISAVVQTNSATSEESAAASEELSSQAAIMKDLMMEFRLRSDDSSYTPAAAPAYSPAAAPAYTPAAAPAYAAPAETEDGETAADASAFSKY